MTTLGSSFPPLQHRPLHFCASSAPSEKVKKLAMSYVGLLSRIHTLHHLICMSSELTEMRDPVPPTMSSDDTQMQMYEFRQFSTVEHLETSSSPLTVLLGYITGRIQKQQSKKSRLPASRI